MGIATSWLVRTASCAKRFHGKLEHVVNFMYLVAEELRPSWELASARSGWSAILSACARWRSGNWKANTIDLSPVLASVTNEFGKSVPGAAARHFLPEMGPADELSSTLDATLFVPYTETARRTLTPVHFHADIANVNRCVGTMLGSEVACTPRTPEDSITIDCVGSGGQSFGAFLPAGITINVIGDANDYFGKGLSGGILTVAPAPSATYKFDENVSIGNVASMAPRPVSGFINGLAGQRFGVRNSGATHREGVGNHGCEYMTGGMALIPGEAEINSAAGMSGAVAFVHDEYGTLSSRCNTDMVELKRPTERDFQTIRALIEEHARRTKSPRGIKMLYMFDDIKDKFVKVIPHEYEVALELTEAAEAAGKTHDEAIEIAFETMRNGR